MATAKTNGSGKQTQAFAKAVQAHRQVQAAQQALRAAKDAEHEAVIAFMAASVGNGAMQDPETGLYTYKNVKTGNGWIKNGDERYLPQHRKLGRAGAGQARAFLRQPGDQVASELED